jgi:hypothetical protein
MRRLLPLLLVPILALAACGDDGEDVSTRPDGDDPTDPTDPTDPAGPGAPADGDATLVVSVEVVGAFTTPEAGFRQLPTQVVYEDGTTASQGAVMAIYPGPAVLPVVRGELAEADVARVREAAVEAGLTGEDLDVGEPPVADAGTTRITVVVDGTEHVTEVPSLGFDEVGPGVDEDQAEARGRVRTFLDELDRLVVGAETSDWLAVDRYRVMALEPLEGDELDVEPNRLDWPLEQAPAMGECTAVTGEDAVALEGVLDRATEITVWTGPDGETFRAAVRPVLPHEPDC